MKGCRRIDRLHPFSTCFLSLFDLQVRKSNSPAYLCRAAFRRGRRCGLLFLPAGWAVLPIILNQVAAFWAGVSCRRSNRGRDGCAGPFAHLVRDNDHQRKQGQRDEPHQPAEEQEARAKMHAALEHAAMMKPGKPGSSVALRRMILTEEFARHGSILKTLARMVAVYNAISRIESQLAVQYERHGDCSHNEQYQYDPNDPFPDIFH